MEKKLDQILNYLKSQRNHFTERKGSEYAALFMHFESLEGDYLLRKLKEDGLIDYDNHQISLTWKGYYFQGYVKIKEMESEKDNQIQRIQAYQLKLSSQMNLATWILAAGSIGLLIFEALKYFYIYSHSCH